MCSLVETKVTLAVSANAGNCDLRSWSMNSVAAQLIGSGLKRYN
jgi:hypothetical protein